MEVKNDVKDLQKRLLNVAILTVVMIVLCVIYRFLMYDGQQGFFYFMLGSVVVGCIAFIYIASKTKEKVLFKITEDGIEFIDGKFLETVKFDQIIRVRCDAMVGFLKAKEKEYADLETFANKPPIAHLAGVLRFDTVNGFHDYVNVKDVMEVVVKLLPYIKKPPMVTYTLGKKEVPYTYFKRRNPSEPVEFYVPKTKKELEEEKARIKTEKEERRKMKTTADKADKKDSAPDRACEN